MKNAILESIKPEFSGVTYTELGSMQLFGPDSQNLNNTAFDEEPTNPVIIENNRAWAHTIKSATAV